MAAFPREGLSATFARFFDSEKSSGIALIACTAIAIAVTNSGFGPDYAAFWKARVAGLTLEHWVNDALMAVFFLLIGLELEREIYVGELSTGSSAALPIAAAVGGMAVPALIHLSLNAGLATRAGFGIPMATDIAFALGVLAILGNRVPAPLRVFVVAFAVIDDLGAIVIIALFYTAELSMTHLAGALAVWAGLVVLNRLRVMSLIPYLAGGVVMWGLMMKSGVHATIAGVMLAFAIPFTARDEDAASPSHRLENFLHKPVAFAILPLFALANAGIVIGPQWMEDLDSANAAGIAAGLVLGKPLGVTLACLAAVGMGISALPSGLSWRHMIGAGMLGGIGFTMSVFIANLAFGDDAQAINASKMAILAASVVAGIAGFAWLRWLPRE